MTLRKEYINEWRIWYNAFNKANKEETFVHPDWLDFTSWLSELGPRPNSTDQFRRDDWTNGWTPDNAGWRTMPYGRNRDYGYNKIRHLRHCTENNTP